MLFSRVFNWIKYKTLPPSLLSLNRLFVERDSKHRRLLSNLGLTFRNSKWSTYTRTNINEITQANLYTFAVTLLYVGLCLLVLCNVILYYDVLVLVDYLFIHLWFSADLEIYLTTCYTFCCWFTLNKALSLVPIPFFGTFNQNNTVKNTSPVFSNSTYIEIPKRLHKSILYSWSCENVINFKFLDLFNCVDHQTQVCSKDFYLDLYKLTRILTKANYTLSLCLHKFQCYLFQSNHSLVNVSQYSSYTTNSHFSLYYTLIVDYQLRQTNISPWSTYSEFNYWNFNFIFYEWWLSSRLLSSKPFYLTQLTYNHFNKLLILNTDSTSILGTVESQLNMRDLHHWLYRYSLLHRSSFHNSSYTSFKIKQIAPSFYMSTFFSRNMWTSTTLTDNFYNHIPMGIYQEALYTSYSPYNVETSLSQVAPFRFINSFLQITFLPTSLNWFLQRFYNFNTLNTNITLLRTKGTSGKQSFDLNTQKNYENNYNQFYWCINRLQSEHASPFITMNNNLVLNNTTSSLSSLGNSYLNYVDYTLFSKLDYETGLNLTVNQGSPILKFYSLQLLMRE